MLPLLARYADRIQGCLSCLDRLIIWGTLPVVCHPAGLADFFYRHEIPLTDLTAFAAGLRDELDRHICELARSQGVEVEYISSSHAFRKEDRIQSLLQQRGDHPGLVHVFAAVEPATVFDVRRGRPGGKPFLVTRRGKCKQFYLYFIDPQFGLCHLRISTWLPFPIQFYCNGHSWLARQLHREGIAFTQADNAFTACADWDRAQQLADAFPVDRLHRALDGWAQRFCPVFPKLDQGSYHWSISQAEYATDLVFKSPQDLRALYDTLRRQAIFTVRAGDIAHFLGRALPEDPAQAGIGSDMRATVEGTRIRHYWGRDAALKMYDKHGLVLRIETTTNNVSFFKHHREVEHRDGTRTLALASMRKTIYSLPILTVCLLGCNRRYLGFLAELSDPTAGVETVEGLAEPIREHGRSYRGFNLFARADLELFLALARGQWCLRGFSNASLRSLLPNRSAVQVSHLLKRLRLRGLIARLARSYRYRLTQVGQRLALAALRLRQEQVIPVVAGL